MREGGRSNKPARKSFSRDGFKKSTGKKRDGEGKKFSGEGRGPYQRPASREGARGGITGSGSFQKKYPRAERSQSDRPSTPYKKRDGEERSFSKERRGPYQRPVSGDDSRGKNSARGPYQKRSPRGAKPQGYKSSTPYQKRDGEEKNFSREKRTPYQGGPPSREGVRGKSSERPPFRKTTSRPDDRPETPRGNRPSGPSKWNRKEKHEFYGERRGRFSKEPGKFRSAGGGTRSRPRIGPRSDYAKTNATTPVSSLNEAGVVRLNKYIANSGVCSRREADKLIESGAITVNGQIITTLGFKIQPGDRVHYGGQKLNNEKPVYLLLNKPKDYITTVDDPRDRKTVMALIKNACSERVYPVGRLDRNTTGLLLFTNDGHLADKLTHPAFEVQKIYEVHLDKNLKAEDLESIAKGVNLEDGFIRPDEISFSPVSKAIVGVELHSGRNRIVRRIFEHFGYSVTKLDRVIYAGLSKKDLPRGKWRFLSPLEISNLKMLHGKKVRSQVVK